MSALINIPNLLSLFRLLSPAIIIPMILNGDFYLALACFIAAALSDFSDGYIARHFKQQSVFGANLDPVADKVFMLSMFFFFMLCNVINWGVTAIVIIRDVLIVCGVLFLKAHKINVVAAPIWASKVNTTLQFLLLLLAFACLQYSCLSIVVLAFSIVVCISTLYSGYLYYNVFLNYLDQKPS